MNAAVIEKLKKILARAEEGRGASEAEMQTAMRPVFRLRVFHSLFAPERRAIRLVSRRALVLAVLVLLLIVAGLSSGCASAPVKRVFLGPWPEDTRPYCCHCHAYHSPCHWEGHR